jgi:hypothetical protein
LQLVMRYAHLAPDHLHNAMAALEGLATGHHAEKATG